MRSVLSIIVGLGLVASLTSCAGVQVEGPVGKSVELVKPGTAVTKVHHEKVWYMFWGLFPLSDSSTAQMIREAKMDVVRVKVYMGLDDMFMSLLGIVPIIPVSRSVMIEGN